MKYILKTIYHYILPIIENYSAIQFIDFVLMKFDTIPFEFHFVSDIKN